MAISYKWTINQMNAHIESEGEQNVIFTVHWIYTGSEEINEKIYSSSLIGAQNFTYKAGEPFTPYENSKQFEDVVISWLEKDLNIVNMREDIDRNINKDKTPVDEKLYFTWNDSIPPVTPEVPKVPEAPEPPISPDPPVEE